MSTDYAASSDDALTNTNTTNSSSNSDDGSSGITYAGQVSLPRLPIPSLEDTMARFPAAVCALLSSSHDSDDGGSSSPSDIHGVNTKEMEECLASIHNFLETDGPLLQKMLVEYERKGREDGTLGSFVEEFWSDAYLAPDSSVVMNLNPFFVLEVSGLFFCLMLLSLFLYTTHLSLSLSLFVMDGGVCFTTITIDATTHPGRTRHKEEQGSMQ
jgi:hypothetical protein